MPLYDVIFILHKKWKYKKKIKQRFNAKMLANPLSTLNVKKLY